MLSDARDRPIRPAGRGSDGIDGSGLVQAIGDLSNGFVASMALNLRFVSVPLQRLPGPICRGANPV